MLSHPSSPDEWTDQDQATGLDTELNLDDDDVNVDMSPIPMSPLARSRTSPWCKWGVDWHSDAAAPSSPQTMFVSRPLTTYECKILNERHLARYRLGAAEEAAAEAALVADETVAQMRKEAEEVMAEVWRKREEATLAIQRAQRRRSVITRKAMEGERKQRAKLEKEKMLRLSERAKAKQDEIDEVTKFNLLETQKKQRVFEGTDDEPTLQDFDATVSIQRHARAQKARTKAHEMLCEGRSEPPLDGAVEEDMLAPALAPTEEGQEGENCLQDRSPREALAASIIQRMTRGNATRRFVMKLRKEKHAVVKIQSVIRGKQGRVQTAKMWQVHKNELQAARRRQSQCPSTIGEFLTSDLPADNSAAMRKIKELEQNPSMQVIDFEFSCIGEQGAGRLAAVLAQKLCALLSLGLKGNYVCDTGARLLSAGVSNNNCLQTLNLAWNSIGDEGAAHICVALVKSASLRNVNLAYNRIGDLGAEGLVLALETNPVLSNLNLEGNRFGFNSAEWLIEACGKSNTSLHLPLDGIFRSQIRGTSARSLEEVTDNFLDSAVPQFLKDVLTLIIGAKWEYLAGQQVPRKVSLARAGPNVSMVDAKIDSGLSELTRRKCALEPSGTPQLDGHQLGQIVHSFDDKSQIRGPASRPATMSGTRSLPPIAFPRSKSSPSLSVTGVVESRMSSGRRRVLPEAVPSRSKIAAEAAQKNNTSYRERHRSRP